MKVLLKARMELNKYNLTPDQKKETLLFVSRNIKTMDFNPSFEIAGNVFWIKKPQEGSPWGQPWKHCFI